MKSIKVNNIRTLNKNEISNEVARLKESIHIISLNKTFGYIESKAIMDKLQAEVKRLESLINE